MRQSGANRGDTAGDRSVTGARLHCPWPLRHRYMLYWYLYIAIENPQIRTVDDSPWATVQHSAARKQRAASQPSLATSGPARAPSPADRSPGDPPPADRLRRIPRNRDSSGGL